MLTAGSVIRSTLSLRCRETLICRNQVQRQGGWRVLAAHRRLYPLLCVVSSSSSPALAENLVPGPGDGSQPAPAGAPTGGLNLVATAPIPIPGDVIMSTAGSSVCMLADSDWEKLGQHLAAYDELREGVIKRCRDVQKLAKQAVYSLHRGDMAGAATQISKAEAIAREMLPTIAKFPALRSGSYAAAIEEYAEASAFACFLGEGRLIRSDELPLAEPEEFLGGVLDFTGELNRYAIARATVRDKAAVQRCRDLLDALMGRFLQFDLRNGALRKKYDSLKYTLKKMESTLYELALTEGMGLKICSEAAVMEPEVTAAEGGGGEA